jgi:DNA replication and repair protein RecF
MLFINHLNLKNFRNYENLEIEFDLKNNINILIAPNGMGKSNFLEAIYYLSYLRSFRNVLDKELIKKGNKFFYLHGKFINNNFSDDVIVKFNNKKEIEYNNKKIQKHSELIGKILTVIFCIDDIFIIIGNPTIRRRYFDMFFSIIDKEYMVHLKTYQNIIKQKNVLLKQKNRDDILSIYDIQLATSIGYIQNKRKELIEDINSIFQLKYQEIGNFTEKTKIIYVPCLKSINSEDLIKELNNDRRNDYEYGFCTSGLHKDNYLFLLNGISFSKYASYGQIRLASLIIKYIQNLFFFKIYDEKPILLLDDVIIELDRYRQINFINKIIENNQIFITIANKENISYIYDNNPTNEIKINYGNAE